MYEYKVRRLTGKRTKIKGQKKPRSLNVLSLSEIMCERLINNESKDGWEFFFKDNRHFYFRRKIK